MKTILIASTNPCKIEACKKALAKVLVDDEFEFISISSNSKIAEQPFGEEETRKGAINRVLDAYSQFKQENSNHPSFVIGLEGGVKKDPMPINATETVDGLMLFGWMAIYQPSTERWGFGRTGSFYVPPEVAKLVDHGMELGFADDQFFGRERSGQQSGTVGILTNDLISRCDYYKHALILAMIPFMHPECY